MRLSSFIIAHREEILEAWENNALGIARRPTHPPLFGPLRDRLGELLEAIARDLDSPQRGGQSGGDQRDTAKNVEVVAERHGAGRAHEGFTLKQIVTEFPALRSCVDRLWLQSLPSATHGDLEDLARFDEALDFAFMESVSKFMERLDRSRETFLGILGHDLRDPLSTIISGARLMQEERFDTTKMGDIAGRIVTTADRMHQLVVDLLDYARTRLGEHIPIERHESDLGKIVQNVSDEFKTAHSDRDVRIQISGDLRGRWDEKRMNQAISNLLGNALHHGAADRPIAISAWADDAEVAIAVHNEGPPIPEERRAQMFEPLSGSGGRGARDRDPSRLGLGLYIAKAVVNGHGGRIDVESSEERGTIFTIRLPRTNTTSSTGEATQERDNRFVLR